MQFQAFSFPGENQVDEDEEDEDYKIRRSIQSSSQGYSFSQKTRPGDTSGSLSVDDSYDSPQMQNLVVKSFEVQSLKRWKSIMPKDFFQLTCDIIVNFEHYQEIGSKDFCIQINSPLQLLRPIKKVIKYKTYSMYITDISSTGTNDFDMAIQRLNNIQTQEAFETGRMLLALSQSLQQLELLTSKLKSIFSPQQLSQLFELNFNKSIILMQDYINLMERQGFEYYTVIVNRMCPVQLSPKISQFISSDKLNHILSSNNIDQMNLLSLHKFFPNTIDTKSYLSIGAQLFSQQSTFEIYICTLDNTIIPCQVKIERIKLSQAEISPGIHLGDDMTVMKFQINSKILQHLHQKIASEPSDLLLLFPEFNFNQNQLKQKYYSTSSSTF